MPSVRLSAIAHAVGAPLPVTDLAEEAAADLASPVHGLVHYRRSLDPVWRLGTMAGERALSIAGHPVDLVIYASETDPDPTASLTRIAAGLGLADVTGIAVRGHGCGNFGPALRLAVDSVRAHGGGRALLVLADSAEGRPRVMRSGLSVFSDGGVACLIDGEDSGTEFSGTESGDFTVDAVITRSRHRAGATDWDLLTLAELAAACAEGIAKETGRTTSEFRYAVFANYRTASQRFFASALRIAEERVLSGEREEFGHCFSADLLITLARASKAGALTTGDTVLVSSIGPHSWSLAALTHR